MPIESEASFLDRKPLMDLYERELFRNWVVQQFVSEQLESRRTYELDALTARRLRELEEYERERLVKELELQKTLASEYERASGRKRKKSNSAQALKLLSVLRSKKLSEIEKYRDE